MVRCTIPVRCLLRWLLAFGSFGFGIVADVYLTHSLHKVAVCSEREDYPSSSSHPPPARPTPKAGGRNAQQSAVHCAARKGEVACSVAVTK